MSARRPGSEPNVREWVKVTPGETSRVRIQLIDEGLLEGTVRLRGDRVPPKPVTVSALRVGASYSDVVKVAASPDGAWSMRVRAGRYKLTAWMTDTGNQNGDQEKVVELEAGGSKLVELEVREARRPIVVTVLEPNGAPSVRATVMGSEAGRNEVLMEEVTDASGQVTMVADAIGGPAVDFWATNGVFSPTVGADGRFRVEDVAPGPHRVIAWGRGGQLADRQVTLTSGKGVDLGDWRMGPARVEPGRLGLYFGMSGDDVTVSWLAEGGPATSLRVGDVVKAIDGAPVLDAGEARQRELGAPGSPATLLILREGRTFPVTLTRAL